MKGYKIVHTLLYLPVVFCVSDFITPILFVSYMQVAANYVAMVPSGQIFDR